MPVHYSLTPGRPVSLADLSARGRDFHNDRKAAEREFETLRNELVDLQQRLYAESQQKLLIVLQAMDAGGKDGAIRKVFRGVNPQGVRVTSFKEPSADELAHDFLWRIHAAVPADGMIGVFNRSHYEDVLVARVESLVPARQWQNRFEHINNFELMLTSTGTRVLKFFLHISKEEQKTRLEARLHDSQKHWKFSSQDLIKRRDWDEYMDAYQDVLNVCTTSWAPWYVIPADQKWYRNLAVARVIVETLRDMNPEFPAAEIPNDLHVE